MTTDNNLSTDEAAPKEKFNFWRFIQLCSLKDFNAFKDEQSQAFTELNSRLTALEEKLSYKTREVQNSVDELHQDLSIKQTEAMQKIEEQINGLKTELNADVSQLQTIISKLAETIAAEFTSVVNKTASQITSELDQKIASSQNTLSSSIENVTETQKTIENHLNDIDNSNKSAQQQALSACASVEDCHQQLQQQTETHLEIKRMCAELLQTVCMVMLDSLSGQIEMQLPEQPQKKR